MQSWNRALKYGLMATVAIGLMWATPAAAQKGPEKAFAGQILTSKKRFPTSAKSPSAYVSAMKKQSESKFWENKDTGEWKIHFASFFKTPLNDLEVTIKIYDVSSKQRQMLASFEQYLDTRGQRSVISYVKLERKVFGVNKELLMTMENRGKVLASGRFKILGEAEKYNGKVEFTEEEAAGKK